MKAYGTHFAPRSNRAIFIILRIFDFHSRLELIPSMIRVERGVVRAEDEIWLLLDEVMESYEPIAFQKGEFKVSKIAYAS